MNKGKSDWQLWLPCMAAPCLSVYGGNWSMIGIMVLLCMAMNKLPKKSTGITDALRAVWVAPTLAKMLPQVSSCWDSNYPWIIPLVLLGLAYYTARHKKTGQKSLIRVLGWMVGIAVALLLLCGLPQIRVEFLKPEAGIPSLWLAPILLLPSLDEGKNSTKTPLLVIAAQMIAVGVLSQTIAADQGNLLIRYGRSIHLLNIPSRLDAVCSCLMTISWYCLLTMLIIKTTKSGSTEWIILAGLALWISGVKIPDLVFAGGSVILWVVVPWLEYELQNEKSRAK